MGQWKDTTAAAEMLAIQVSALSRCHYYLQMAGQGGFASGHRRIRRSEAFGGRAPAEERTGAIGGGAFGRPDDGCARNERGTNHHCPRRPDFEERVSRGRQSPLWRLQEPGCTELRSPRFSSYWSSFSFNAALTVRFQIGFPALAARRAFLCSSLEATMRFPLSRMISNTNLFSPRFTMSRAMTSSSIFTLWTVTRSGGWSFPNFICLSSLLSLGATLVR